MRWVLRKKFWSFLEIAKDGKIAVECDWKCEISQNVHGLVFLELERIGFFEKIPEFFKQQ